MQQASTSANQAHDEIDRLRGEISAHPEADCVALLANLRTHEQTFNTALVEFNEHYRTAKVKLQTIQELVNDLLATTAPAAAPEEAETTPAAPKEAASEDGTVDPDKDCNRAPAVSASSPAPAITHSFPQDATAFKIEVTVTPLAAEAKAKVESTTPKPRGT